MIYLDELHYYQGFGDICSVLLLVCGEKIAFNMARKLAITHLKDNMAPTMQPTMNIINVSLWYFSYIYVLTFDDHIYLKFYRYYHSY